VVLGGGMSPRGSLHTSSTVRVDQGVVRYKSGSAPRMHFTGGLASPNAPSAGQQMALRAVEQGVPERATSFEGKSYSTLQNALFSKPQWRGADHIILVTEGFPPDAFAASAFAQGSACVSEKPSPFGSTPRASLCGKGPHSAIWIKRPVMPCSINRASLR